jgi:hypothetical protein
VAQEVAIATQPVIRLATTTRAVPVLVTDPRRAAGSHAIR